MPNGDEKKPPKAAPDFEVRYSERFQRERTRSNRRGLLFGGLGFLIVGGWTLNAALGAFRTGEIVHMGRRMPDLPAFLAAPVGVVFGLIGVGLLWAWVTKRG